MKIKNFVEGEKIQVQIKKIEAEISSLKLLHKNPKKISSVSFSDKDIKPGYSYGFFQKKKVLQLFLIFLFKNT